MPEKISRPSPDDVCGVRVIHLKRISQAQREALPVDDLQRLADTFKIMGDPNRLKLLMALKSGEMCVCDLAAFLGISESAVSHQLRRLKDARLVHPRRQGQILFYHLDDDCIVELMAIAERHHCAAHHQHNLDLEQKG
jgi:ArsR family transcriptional regulator, lead/cadmium/zinc/bismuth-responsive transcriptional repressor